MATTPGVDRRRACRAMIVWATVVCANAPAALAQVSQRRRQLRDRAECENSLPACKPEIREQLEAEKARIRWGLAGLGMMILAGGTLIVRRLRTLQMREKRELSALKKTLNAVSGDSPQNRAKSEHHD